MLKDKLIASGDLEKYGLADDLNTQAFLLVQHQQETWELAGENYAALKQVQKRYFNFDAVQIEVHHNPGRIRSSAAKTDAESIAGRPCFLCENNLPGPQKGLPFDESFIILANPYPIFPVHLTIAHTKHLPQQLGPYFEDMLELSRELYGFTVFYNGPQCGASAPDHFHFQAGNRGVMPVEKELDHLDALHTGRVLTAGTIKIDVVENGLRRFLVLESSRKDVLAGAFKHLYDTLIQDQAAEPMMNVISMYDGGRWRVVIFPRERQRSSHYYRTGINRLLVSPAAVEMGGLLILPRHTDFLRMDEQLIAEVYDEVTASHETIANMTAILSKWEIS